MDARPPLAVLSGVRVLSFTQFLLGPSGVQFIADLGADVIKIEPPGGTLWERNWAGSDLYLNGVSTFFLSTHRNQRSLTLDLKHPDGLAVARRLVEGADVLVQNFRPGVMARLGLGWETVRAWNPRLVYVSASGYGETSPYRDRPGQDLLLQALSGLASISGRAGQPPTPVGTAVVDQHGATLLAMGVLAALLERGRTGQGLHVEVSMLRAALDLQLEIVTYVLNGAQLSKSPTSLASMFHPGPYGCYETRDGWLVLSMSPLKILEQALDLPALAPYTRGPVQLPGPRGDRPHPRARDADARDRRVGRSPGAARGLGGAGPHACRGPRRPGRPRGGRGGGRRPSRRGAGAPPPVPARALVGAGHREPAGRPCRASTRRRSCASSGTPPTTSRASATMA